MCKDICISPKKRHFLLNFVSNFIDLEKNFATKRSPSQVLSTVDRRPSRVYRSIYRSRYRCIERADGRDSARRADPSASAETRVWLWLVAERVSSARRRRRSWRGPSVRRRLSFASTALASHCVTSVALSLSLSIYFAQRRCAVSSTDGAVTERATDRLELVS